MSLEERKISYRLARLTDDEVKKLEKLIEQYPAIEKLIESNQLWKSAFTWILDASKWLIAVVGAITLGFDKLKVFFTGIVG